MNKIPNDKIEKIRLDYPGLPNDYLHWLKTIGSGEFETGDMIYDAPIEGKEIAPKAEGMLVIADDMSGYMVGYVKEDNEWKFRGLESCGWQFDSDIDTFTDYLNQC